MDRFWAKKGHCRHEDASGNACTRSSLIARPWDVLPQGLRIFQHMVLAGGIVHPGLYTTVLGPKGPTLKRFPVIKKEKWCSGNGRLFNNYFTGSSCEVQLKWKSFPFNGLSMNLLGLKEFLIWVFILLVMVSFVLRGKSVISAIPAN